MNIRDFFSFRKNSFFWGNLLAMIIVVIAIVFGTFKWLDHYTEHDISVTVPDIKGMRLQEAQALLKNYTLVGVVSDSTYNTNKPGGTILETNPISGSVVKEKRIVYLTINTSRVPTKIIPDLIDNCSLREAEAKLLAMGFKLGENDSIEGEKDWIYGIKYRGTRISNGDEIPTGATLVLEVGSGDFIPGLEKDSLRDTKNEEATIIEDSWFD